MKNFQPVKETIILIVAWLTFIISISAAAKHSPIRLTDENLPITFGVKESLIKEFDSGVSRGASERDYKANFWMYVRHEFVWIVLALVFGTLTFRKGYDISEQTGRSAITGGVVALLGGPLCFALHMKPR